MLISLQGVRYIITVLVINGVNIVTGLADGYEYIYRIQDIDLIT